MEKSFIYRVAEAYYRQHSDNISDITFVFPNRRAGLFFQRCLSQMTSSPIFSPKIITINDCFSLASPYQKVDRLSLLFRLYTIYKHISKSDESFDSFIFWGEMILSDFNDIDRYRVDAKKIFTNITDLKEIDNLFEIFSDKQLEAIREFWGNFNPSVCTSTKDGFIATWKVLYPVYKQFSDELLADGLATDGMISRFVVENLESGADYYCSDNQQFVFVGFNALNPCERALFKELKKRQQADFYWDYEFPQLRDSNNPASRYMAENLYLFPSRYEIQPCYIPLNNKHIHLIGVPSSVGQAKQIFQILSAINPSLNSLPLDGSHSWTDSAIVLPDESLLLPLLHSIPRKIDKVNITMGYPVKATAVSGLIDHIFELHKRVRTTNNSVSFYHANVLNILNHQYIHSFCDDLVNTFIDNITKRNLIYIQHTELHFHPLLAVIFQPQGNSSEFLPYLLSILRELLHWWQLQASANPDFRIECDFIFQYYSSLNRLNDIFITRPHAVDVSTDTLMRIIKQLVAGVTVPFIGEPLDGLQVMGVLETRGLDFRNLIISSFNEGVFPAKSNSNSFIPYNLRKGFELPTSEYQDAIVAYNFYRLISRAESIFLLYDSRAEGLQTGEVSRFIHQLHYLYPVQFTTQTVTFDIKIDSNTSLQIEKTPEICAKLDRFLQTDETRRYLSASSINKYIDCPLQFYMSNVENISESDEVAETVEADTFGNIFHKTMELLYEPYCGQNVSEESISSILAREGYIEHLILRAFNSEYFKRTHEPYFELEGNNLLISSVLKKYIQKILEVDKENTPFKYIASEEKFKIQFPIGDANKKVNIMGFFDRIDEVNGETRILDYKTGKGDLDFVSLEDAFERNLKSRPKFVLQTMLYGMLYKSERPNSKSITPGIVYLRKLFKDDFDTRLYDKTLKSQVRSYDDYAEQFSDLLTTCINEIFNPDIPFYQTDNTETCGRCIYQTICNR